MKKVKIMLTVVALFAVVGGTVAFRAARIVQHTFFTINQNKTSCNLPLALFATIDPTTTTLAPLGFSTVPSPLINCTLVLKASL